jgi:hypothetical protein
MNCAPIGRHIKAGNFVAQTAYVLLDLYDAQLVSSTFRLNGKNVLCAFLIHANVHLVGLDLTHVRRGGAEVVLQRIAGHSSEDVDQPVLAQARSHA